MIKKIDLGAAMGGFAQAGDAGFVYGETTGGNTAKIKKADLLNNKSYYLEIGKELDLGINPSGLLRILSYQITGMPAIVIAANNSSYFQQVGSSTAFSFGEEIEGKMCIYKKEDTGNIIAKNLSTVNSSLNISII